MAEAARILPSRWSTAARLSLRFTALYALVTTVAFAMAYAFTDYEITATLQEQLELEERILRAVYAESGLDAVASEIEKLYTLNVENQRLFYLTDAAGEVISGNISHLTWDGSGFYVDLSQIRFRESPEIEASGYFVRAVSLGPNRLVLGISASLEAEILESLAAALVAGFVAIMLVGTGAGVFVGRRAERQLSAISAVLGSVSAGNIALRLPSDRSQSSDLRHLSAEINSTLDNLQKLIESQRQISTDIAHDLKTPLQRLRQRLERLGQSSDLPPETRTEIDASIDVVDELMGIFHALLRISQIETNNRRERFAPVDLRGVLSRIEDAYGAVAEEREQTLIARTGPGPRVILGDEELLTQMMVNAVENALRHCPDGATIEMSLEGKGDAVTFSVADNGPGIPEAERKLVFDRFYRIEKSRTSPGNGLGLSLIKAIADLHRARIELSSNDPGLRLSVSFPPAGTTSATAPI